MTIENASTTNGRRAHRRAVRAERQARAQLRRELAGFTSPAELLELSALLRRHDDSAAEPIRDIIDWQPAEVRPAA